MRRAVSSFVFLAVAFALLVSPASGRAQIAAPSSATARVDLAPDRVVVDPGVSAVWSILRLSGPREWEHTEVFEADRPIVFQLTPESAPSDGRIDWELTFLARGSEDPTRSQRLRGSFRVSAGRILTSVEEAPNRSPAPPSPQASSAVAPGAALSEHVSGDLTLTGGLCAGCASGSTPGFGSVFVDARFALNERVAFGDGVNPTLLLRWDPMASRFSWSTPLASDDFDLVFGEYKLGLSTGTIPKELNLAGEPLPDPNPLVITRRTPEIRFQAVTQSFSTTSFRDWDLGADTLSFFVRDATADTIPLKLEAGATGQIVVAAHGVDIGGDLFLPEGEMTAQTVRLSSSRSRKEHFVPVDPDALLQRLGQVPVYEWSFRGDESGARHVGPVAEDFHAAFALPGQSAEHLSVTDLAGISLAAIQALERRVAALEAENRRLVSGVDPVKSICEGTERTGLLPDRGQ